MGRRTKIRLISFAVALLAVLISAITACHVGAGGFEARIDAHSSRSFGEAFNAVEQLDRSLRKCQFAAGKSMESILCAQIYSGAQSAQTSLSMLPVQLDALEQIAKQIAVMGDYAFSLLSFNAEGSAFSDDQIQKLSDFSGVTAALLEQLEVLRQAYEDGSLVHEKRLRLTDSLSNLEEKSSSLTETLDGAFHRIRAMIPETSHFIYDGQFGVAEDNVSAGSDEEQSVSQARAKKTAADFLAVNPENLKNLDSVGGACPCWRFSLAGDEKGLITVSSESGMVIRYLADPSGSIEKRDLHDCVDICSAFLQSHGYINMVEDDTFSEQQSDAVCFVYEQEGVRCLPDRIVMRADAETGKVTAFDASAYQLHHRDRQMPYYDPDDFRDSIPDHLSVQSSKLVLMCSPGGTEILCAEFLCKDLDDQTARVYVDTKTGQQLKILLEGETENSRY